MAVILGIIALCALFFFAGDSDKKESSGQLKPKARNPERDDASSLDAIGGMALGGAFDSLHPNNCEEAIEQPRDVASFVQESVEELSYEEMEVMEVMDEGDLDAF